MTNLIRVNVNSDSELPLINRVRNVMNKIKEESIFYGKEYRFLLSSLAFLITVDGQDAGFIYFVNEDNKTSKILFADIAILNEYKKNNIAYTSIRAILDNKELIKNRFVLAEVEEYNINCLKFLQRLKSEQVDDKHFLLQPERLKEFNDYLEDSNIDIEEPVFDYREMYDEIMNSEDDGYQKKIMY